MPVGAPCAPNKRTSDLATVDMPSSAIRGQRPPRQPGQPPGNRLPPHLSWMLCGPPATHPPTQERCLSTSPHPGLMMAQLPSGEDIITPQAPPITPDPSVAFTAPPGPGPLAKANAFEKSSPSSHTELHPKPTGPAPGRQLHFRPQGLRQGAAPRTAGPPQGVSRAGLCEARGCGPSPATRVGAPAFFPL